MIVGIQTQFGQQEDEWSHIMKWVGEFEGRTGMHSWGWLVTVSQAFRSNLEFFKEQF